MEIENDPSILKIIDVSYLTKGKGSDSYSKTSNLILNEFLKSGYICIKGYGIPKKTIEHAYISSEQFFSSSLEDKLKSISLDKARRGYSPFEAENYASLIGEKRQNDKVEKFRVGPELTSENLLEPYYSCKLAKSFFFPNNWENTPSDFKENISDYYSWMERLTFDILSALECALNLPNCYFTGKMLQHTSILTINYFEGIDISSNSEIIRIAEHTDVSMLTIVSQSECSLRGGRLELYSIETDRWIPFAFQDESFVVHVGDCLADWTGGVLKSTRHRVVSKSESHSSTSPRHSEINREEGSFNSSIELPLPDERYSLAYFATPNYKAEIELPIAKTSLEYHIWRKNRIKTAMKVLSSIS